MRVLSIISVVLFAAAMFSFCGGGGNGGTDEADKDAVDVQKEEIEEDVPVNDVKDTAQDKVEPDDAKDVQDVKQDIQADKGGDDVKTELTCAEAGLCVFGCEYENKGDACINACFANGSTEAQVNLKYYRDCVMTKCDCDKDCSGTVNWEQFSDCVYLNCDAERKACLVGEGDCRDIYTCRKECLEGDELCPIKCLVSSTDEDQKEFLEYKKCLFDTECKNPENLQPNGWPIETCEKYANMHNCPKPYQTCVPPFN
ncbi:MAG: hypothetical protein FJ088_14850 [Deltaproteobacteria bacterium]|nr:hypothetical protein [Deltaproteobacteria bacterium]